MDTIPKYKLSFTAASLKLSESIKIAEAVLELGITNLNDVRLKGIVFSSVKVDTANKEFREIRDRLKTLTSAQRDILVHGDLVSQKQIAFLAVCKHYAFIRDFVSEILRDKTLVFDYKIKESDFKVFIDSKLELHPELETFTERTLQVARQVMFLMMAQAGIINNVKEKIIQPQLLRPSVIRAIVEDDPNLLRIFFYSDRDIDKIRS